MKRLSDYSAEIEKILRDLKFPGGALDGLYSPISYSLTAGGKRLRPALTMMSADAFGDNPGDAVNAAIGLEIFHNFTLLHDDVMDESELRRGRPTVHTKWDVNTAILSGDTMLTVATDCMTRVQDHLLRDVMHAFNDMALRVYEGQRLDMDFENLESVSTDDYIRMISDKTGALLGASAKIGALIGGATEEDASHMAAFGIMLGIAFQIQDDWLDVFGDSTTFGKPIGGDINNNKKTFLLVSALNEWGRESDALREAMRMNPGDTKIKVVTRLYERMNMSDKCREVIRQYSSKALAMLKATSLSEERREPFRLMVDKLTGRTR